MKFQIEVTSVRGEWWEIHDEASVTTDADAVEFGNRVVAYFNSTLRPHEDPRTFTGNVKILGPGQGGAHDWEKRNLMTLSDHRGMFDKVECRSCGVTGRRYGLGTIKRSAEYRAKKYDHCKGVPTPIGT